MWEVGERGWVSFTVGVAAGGVAGQGAPGRDNEHKGLAGWNFAGLDLVVDRFGRYVAALIIV